VVLDSLVEGLLVDDGVVAIDQVLFELVGEDALQRVHFVGRSHFLDRLGHRIVEVSGF
jgi:hypothetical protein